jgi:hypothetical protein
MKSLLCAGAVALALMGVAPAASAAILTEDFEAPFPAWESGWFGQNSNARNYYSDSTFRGNNPDGLWLLSADGDQNENIEVVFDSGFAASLTSFYLDVAGYTPTTLSFFDKDNALIQAFNVTLTFGAEQNPGTYARYGVTSNNGIGRFHFSSDSTGNTSIDNLEAITGGAVVPEPATWAMMIIGFGAAGSMIRRRKPAVA